ncbi:polysaccharide deacetylase family protein [Streptomyces sp. NPDC013953]|uniref:polysaccharide deacetylase family protein n=1 Tax=Streptomyces sp. NPDC013953 TaxID=3364868 RepID=UPI0036F4C8DC
MKNDELPPGRRMVLRIAAVLGATTTVGLFANDRFTPERAGTPSGPSTARPARGPGRAAAAPPAAAGPQAGARLAPSAYRLQPMTAESPPRYRRALPPVRQRPLLRVSGIGRTMVLSFDDGPDPRYTPAVLRTLRAHGVRAMFFVCGEMAAYRPDLLREMTADGHVVGNHSWSHPNVTKLAPSGIRDELGRTCDVIERSTGAPPLWYRAPYGAWNRDSFEIGAELGMEPLAWTVDTLDWTEPGSSAIVRRVMDGAAPGVVVLSHDAGGDRSQSVAALKTYLPRLLDAGYHLTVPRR